MKLFTTPMLALLSLGSILVAGAAVGGCGSSSGDDDNTGAIDAGGADAALDCTPDTTYDPTINPADFVGAIDNPYWPLTPGTRYTFGGAEDVVVSVTRETKVILGVTCVVVQDTVMVDGEVTEDTFDWFAQDADGNVWYFGEDTKEYEGGQVVSTAGSWEGGVGGAKPGIVMAATPSAADGAYRQEYLVCEAEDEAEVVGAGVAVSVPYGDFTDCVETREFTRLSPGGDENKYYCAGVGVVAEEDIESGDRVELTAVTTF